MAAVDRLRNTINIAALHEPLERGDIAAAVALIGLEGAFDDLGLELSFSFAEAAALAALALSASFDHKAAVAVEARAVLRQETVTRIAADSTRAIAETVQRSLKSGLDAASTLDRARAAIGLTAAQARSLDAYRNALEDILVRQSPIRATLRIGNTIRVLTSPFDPNIILRPELLRTLSASQRSAIKAAIARANLTPEKVASTVDRHRRALLEVRANAIAATEATRATNAGELAAWQQAAERGAINPNTMRRFWRDAGDEKVRANHRTVSNLNSHGVK